MESNFDQLTTVVLAGLLALVVTSVMVIPAQGADSGLEHFEKKIRPLLVEKCYSCHSTKASSVFAGLHLDSHAGLLKGGDSGPAVVPGNSKDSLLLQAVRGEAKVPMPPMGRLHKEQIRDLQDWVEAGAPWPEEMAESAPDPTEVFDLAKRRQAHWAWQPVNVGTAPVVKNTQWAQTPIDSFLLAALEKKGLEPAHFADRYTLLRRLTYDLTGLPSTLTEISSFVGDKSTLALETVVDRLLASPHFGERWARHWMDLMRYTESHGSEGDPDLPEAWRYRDYLIRAFNADVPYDQLLREHLAGDLLSNPRINEQEDLNESMIGPAHFRMVEHGFQPVDPWEDRVKWTDNQVDVFSKAFQGLTISCARCHDHKFDAISQQDYYALFGIFANARPVQRAIDSPHLLEAQQQTLRMLKSQVHSVLGKLWQQSSAKLAKQFLDMDESVQRELEAAACEPDHPLHPWFLLSEASEEEFQSGWKHLTEDWVQQRSRRKSFNAEHFQTIWDLGENTSDWISFGTGLGQDPVEAGEFSILPEGDRVTEAIYGPGMHTGLLTRRHNGVLQSPRFTVDSKYISFLVQGGDFSVVRLIVENYAVPRSGIYDQRYTPKEDEPRWITWDATYWKGFSAYIEFATMQDATNFRLDTEDSRKNPRPQPGEDGRSHFGALAVAFHNTKVHPRPLESALSYLYDGATPKSRKELAELYASRLEDAVLAWQDGSLTAGQADYLDYNVRSRLLPTMLDSSESLENLVSEYRRIEQEVPIYRRAPGVVEEAGPNMPLLIRGDHKSPGELVPRRYLEALDSKPYQDPASMRTELAAHVTDSENPLTSRVMVNRVWQKLFGRGIVATTDNFGRLGSTPSHPELLDYLANQFMQEGWSIKNLIRRMVLSAAYQLSSESSEQAMKVDPDNTSLQHMSIRRLESEVIRDSLLAVSGRFDPTVQGQSINVYYAFAKGKTKGDRAKGPLDGDGRRSVYQEIRRNAHNPFLEVFDQPKPASARGQRDVTNVPAQSLTMMNSPLIVSQAELWGNRLSEGSESAPDTVRRMFLESLGRPPTAREVDQSLSYLGKTPDAAAWTDLGHAIFNLKEFIYIR